ERRKGGPWLQAPFLHHARSRRQRIPRRPDAVTAARTRLPPPAHHAVRDDGPDLATGKSAYARRRGRVALIGGADPYLNLDAGPLIVMEVQLAGRVAPDGGAQREDQGEAGEDRRGERPRDAGSGGGEREHGPKSGGASRGGTEAVGIGA